MHQSPP
ncbi:hypothetical protein YPPY98_1757, partial [Yersinia pestis PY-98]